VPDDLDGLPPLERRHDPVALALALLAGGAAATLDGDHVPLAADRDGEAAVSLVLLRDPDGTLWLETTALHRTAGRWRALGGGLSDTDRASLARPGPGGAPLRVLGGGGAAVGDPPGLRRLLPGGGSWVGYAVVQASSAVARLVVQGRSVPVPVPGLAVVCWRGRRPPQLAAAAADGTLLAQVRP
jgi:hypothetical protein